MSDVTTPTAGAQPTGSAGRLLQAGRERRGLELDALAQLLKVPVRKLQALDGQVFLDETDDTYCVWRTEYSRKLCTYYMDLFRRRGDGAWRRSAELHRQRAYSAEELTAWLTEAGFGDIRVYGDGKLRRPKEDEQRIYFSCVRK